MNVIVLDRNVAMVRLILSFHTLARYPYRRFDPRQFQRWARKTQSSGGMHAARFILSVWNPTTRWGIGRFDVHAAMGIWDTSMRAAFVAWARDPWWP